MARRCTSIMAGTASSASAGSPFTMIKDHVLLPLARRIAGSGRGAGGEARPRRSSQDIVAQVPDGWLPDADAFADPASAARGLRRLSACGGSTQRQSFVEEAIRARRYRTQPLRLCGDPGRAAGGARGVRQCRRDPVLRSARLSGGAHRTGRGARAGAGTRPGPGIAAPASGHHSRDLPRRPGHGPDRPAAAARTLPLAHRQAQLDHPDLARAHGQVRRHAGDHGTPAAAHGAARSADRAGGNSIGSQVSRTTCSRLHSHAR